MNTGNSILLISQEDVKKILGDNTIGVSLVENAFKRYRSGNVMMPDKISQIFDEISQNRINCMPASLIEEKISGVKWVSVFPNNPKKGLKNVSGVIILSELEYGFPVAIMDGTEITNVRTAAVGACAAKYLARKDSKTIGFIGAGKEAKTHFEQIKAVLPRIEKCYISSRTEESVKRFCESEARKYPDVEFVNCANNYESAIRDADIIVTATSTQKDLLKAKWIKKGVTYIHVGGWEDEFQVAKQADKIVCDNWECVKHRGQTICRMYKKGILNDSDIYANMDQVIIGEKKGRETDEEFIYFNSVGLAFIDIYFANYVYEKMKILEEKREFEF